MDIIKDETGSWGYVGDEAVNCGELDDSLGKIPTTLAGRVDRFELQHPVLTYVYPLLGGALVGAGVAHVRHGDSISASNSLSVQINQLQHETPRQTEALTSLQEQKSHLNTGGGELFGGLMCGVLVYAGLRAALRTRFGWVPGTARRNFHEGPIPAPRHRFTSLSVDSIHERKKRLALWQASQVSSASEIPTE